jgi:SSS family solute:Na+ symporter
VGILYLWGPQSDLWPHFMMLSFLLCVILILAMMGISMFDRQPVAKQAVTTLEGQNRLSRLVVTLWLLLAAVMISLYIFFN